MEDQIVVCAACSGKNRLPGSALAANTKARCGHCGGPLSPASIDEAAGIRAAVIDSAPQPRARVGRWISGIILSIFATAGYWFYAGNPDLANFDSVATTAAPTELPAEPFIPFEPTPEPAPTLEPEPTFIPAPLTVEEPIIFPELAPLVLEPVWIAPGLQNNWTGLELVAPLSIVTSYGQNYYVKLVFAGTDTEAASYYVEGGSTADFFAPLGSYEMRYASGTIWYGQTDLFGPETSYAKAIGSFDFSNDGGQYTGYTVELILQADGNLDTAGISASEF